MDPKVPSMNTTSNPWIETKEVKFMLLPMSFVDERATSYATVTDFFKAFNEEMHSLYLLAFLLTADHDKAEQCLVSAMGECLEGMGVFMDWARSWARGAVLKHAIQMIMPTPQYSDSVSMMNLARSGMRAENDPFAAILLLDAFDRFVFVMSILEEQSDEECANLLRCSQRDVMIARLVALKRQSHADALAGEILQS
jgi:hypothetical protein